MKITVREVMHVAELARLKFGEGELERFAVQLGSIIEYIGKLEQLDTSGVPPAFHVLDMPTPVREDEVIPLLTAEEALVNAPRSEEGYFTVPKFIED
jgi:aspartyl-tRNA(Asn)/glutamyl-tRNA(Gln) amidotransferase subunit C